MADKQNLSLDESLDHDVSVGHGEQSYIDYNAELNLFSPDGKIQFDADKKAARQYFLTHVNPNTVYFHNIEEKLEYLVEHGYYEKEILEQYISPEDNDPYCSEFIKELFKHVYNYKYRFDTFMGALKFYSSYSMKTNDGKRYLERYEDRIVMVALTLAEGDKDKAVKIADEIITGKLQPATPTFLNAGKKQRGEYVSCFPAGTPVMTDNGYKNIEDITIEDKVLSHDGLFHEVEEKIVNSNSERLVRIKHYGNKEDLLLTPNHPVLVWTNRNIDTLIDGDGADINKGFVWLESQDVTEEDFIVGANVNETKNQTINSEFYKIEDNKIVYQVKNVEITDDIPDTVYNLEVKDAHTYTVNNVIVHNCFLLRTEDSMESIANTITSSLQLSKRGGGVGILLTNIREQGSTIKNIEGASSGVIPVMKLLEDSFTYANQLGARQGAGAVYISACHPDVLSVLDTKRENADEKVRIKTLSIGLVIPDIAFEMARKNENLYLFSPKDVYDVYGVPMSDISITEKYHEMVEDPRISKKKISARHLFQTIAELQFESGYPYLMFEDTANQWNNIDGRINMSNLCVSGDTEVLTDTGYKKAKDLYESQEDFNVIVDERARTMDLSNIGTSVQKSTKMFKTKENAAVFKLTTLEGREITATPWHKMYAKRNEEIIKLPLSELEVGDSILINSDHIDQRGTIHNPDLAYISGILVADGSVGSNNKGSNSAKLYLYGEKEECLEKITKSIKNSLKGREDLVERQSTLEPEFIWDENSNRHVLSSSPLYKLLKEQDYDIKEQKVQVPDFVKNADRETQVEFLNGVFQMDGCVTGSKQYNSISIELGSIHHEFLKDIQKLLGTFGISARVYVSKKEDSYTLLPDGLGGEKEYYQKKSWVLKTSSLQESSKLYDLLQWRKPHNDRWEFLTKDREKPVYNIKRNKFAIVKDIEFVGYEDVYDVTVENGHSLIFDGIVTGNCSEILQINTPAEFDERGNVKEDAEGRDISCNLASLNIANVMKKGDFKDTVHTAIHSLTTVSDNTNISIVPNVRNGNEKSHSIGLGTMNLHGFLGSEKIHYGSDEALDFTNVFYATLRYHSLKASVEIAKDKGTFYDFDKSDYAITNDQGFSKALENYTNGTWETFPHTQRIKEMYSEYDQWYPQQEDWKKLDKEIQEHGLYHAYLNANAPTGNISYVNNSTSSLHPIVAKIEARKQSGLGRVYYPAYGLNNDNVEYYDDAYDIGYKAIIDTYAVAGKHIDQGQSLTLFFKNTDTTRTLNKAYNYAWSRGKEKNEFGEVALYDPRTSWKSGIVKTLYYSRIRSDSLEGTELEGCVSCTI